MRRVIVALSIVAGMQSAAVALVVNQAPAAKASAQPGSPTRVSHVAVARDRDRPALVSRSAVGGPPGWKISGAEPLTG
jgi:hypothetical protein